MLQQAAGRLGRPFERGLGSQVVMARLVPTGGTHLVSQSERTWFGGRDGQFVPLISATGAATDGPDAPGHDGWGMSAAPAMALICLTGAEMCECRRDEPGHDGKARPMRLSQTVACCRLFSSRRLILIAMGTRSAMTR